MIQRAKNLLSQFILRYNLHRYSHDAYGGSSSSTRADVAALGDLRNELAIAKSALDEYGVRLQEAQSTQHYGDQSLWQRIGEIEQLLTSRGAQISFLMVEHQNLTNLCQAVAIQQQRKFAEKSDEIAPHEVVDRDGLISRNQKLEAELEQYSRVLRDVASERDNLLNVNDLLRRQFQDANRDGGLKKSTGDVHGLRSEFPPELLLELSVDIVDVGAQNLVSEEHIYSPIVRADRAKIVAFEPLSEKADERRGEANLIALNYFIGSGKPALFHVTKFDAASSLYEPNEALLSHFTAYGEMYSVSRKEEVSTVRLDDVREIRNCDLLKIDVQGGELDVLKGASRLLQDIVCIHTEVEFAPLYVDQPLFCDVDIHLRAAGFDLIDMINAGYGQYKALGRPSASSRLLWADAVYFKNPQHLTDLRKLLIAAFIAHTNYGMSDLAASYLDAYDARTGKSASREYQASLLNPAVKAKED